MIHPKIKQLIETYKKELPEYHQEVLSSFDWPGISEEIAAKYHLSDRQIDLFVGEITMMLYQITDPELLKNNLMNHIGVSEAIAHNMILHIKSRILDRLQAELVRVVGEVPDMMEEELTKAGLSGEQARDMVMTAQSQVSQTADVLRASDPYHEAID